MSFKNRFKDLGNKPELPEQLKILKKIEEKKEEVVETKCCVEIKKKPTYFSQVKPENTGSVVLTAPMAEVADVESYDDRPNTVKQHSDGKGEKSARVF